jgi:glycine cleavage system aminomethyltransferase T
VEGQTWRRWAGYVVASSYELHHDREYHAIRSSAALFDVSPLFKYHVRGKDAVRLLDRVVTRDVASAWVGRCLYTLGAMPPESARRRHRIGPSPDFLRLTSAELNYRGCAKTRL